jgi:DNA uptake protein ComE-like DNA-binding protein
MLLKINFANKQELQSLNGVDPKVAENVLKFRASSGNKEGPQDPTDIQHLKLSEED